MLTRYRKTLVALSAITVCATAITGLHAQSKPPVYAIIDISEISDVDAYVKAVSAAEPKASNAAGGRFVIRSNKATALDGGAPNRFVVIAFESEEKAKAWYAAVKNVNDVRMKVAKSRAFLVEGLAN